MENLEVLDCAISGGGPVGLTAAIYLGRFLRSARIFSAGKPRAASIDLCHNLIGHSQGIPGPDVLKNLERLAHDLGVR